jgi:hypothetical protein
MFAIKPVAWNESEEKLRSVGVWSSVGHGKLTSLGVFNFEVFIIEFVSIDRFTTGSIS